MSFHLEVSYKGNSEVIENRIAEVVGKRPVGTGYSSTLYRRELDFSFRCIRDVTDMTLVLLNRQTQIPEMVLKIWYQ